MSRVLPMARPNSGASPPLACCPGVSFSLSPRCTWDLPSPLYIKSPHSIWDTFHIQVSVLRVPTSAPGCEPWGHLENPQLRSRAEMANLARTVASKAQGLFKWLKAPWQITGPVASEDYRNAIWDASEYRHHAPATQPERAYIPHAQPNHVVDIKYYVRDRRRQAFETHREELNPHALPEEVQTQGPAAAISEYYVMGEDVHLNDAPGAGYQK